MHVTIILIVERSNLETLCINVSVKYITYSRTCPV